MVELTHTCLKEESIFFMYIKTTIFIGRSVLAGKYLKRELKNKVLSLQKLFSHTIHILQYLLFNHSNGYNNRN